MQIPYLGMVVDTMLERVPTTESRITRFWVVVKQFLSPESPSTKLWPKLPCHVALLKWLSTMGDSGCDHSSGT